MVERNSGGDPLVELIKRLHDKSEGDMHEITKEEALILLLDCKFDAELKERVMADFNKQNMNTEDFIRRVKEIETDYGKTSNSHSIETKSWEPAPIIANPGLFSTRASMAVEENPWQRTLSRLELSSAEHDADKGKLDVDCVMVNVHELAGTLFRHVNYKVQVSYGTDYGAGHETFVNSVVLRRYSDFAWLHAYLCSKFLFRPVAPIPPKQLTTPTEAGELELAKKRLPGLQAFLVACLQHPVFAKDATVRAFLTQPGVFADWRVSAAEADISEEQAVAQRSDLNEEAMHEPLPLSDDPLFEDALKSLEGLGLYTEGLIDSTSAICQTNVVSSNAAIEIAESLSTIDAIFSNHKSQLDTAFQKLAETSRQTQTRSEALNSKVIRRLTILHAMITGLEDCITRLQTNTFTDFPGLARQLIALQGEIRKAQLRDGPSVQSTQQLSLISQSQRLQRLYNYYYHRNEWASITVKQEIESFMQRHMKELLIAINELSMNLQ